MNGVPDDAFFYLRNGEFEKAKKIFSIHLDKDPSCMEWIEGYFISSFWDNKLDHLLRLREGKDRGRVLLQYLDFFESELIARKFPRLQSFQECIQCVLEETTRNLGIAYRLEGWNGLDRESIKGLASCHIRLNQFDKALDIINITGGDRFQNSEYLFLKADCLIGLNRPKEGIPLFILGFMDDPFKFPATTVQWEIATKAFLQSKSSKFSDSISYLIIPYLILKDGNFDDWIQLSSEDFLYFYEIANRMKKSFYHQTSDNKIKTILRMGFIAEILVRSRQERIHSLETGEMRLLLGEIKKDITDLLPE